MCGIAGEFAFEREQVTAVASRMIATLRHRGPDSSGHYVSPAKNVLLVNTRLAVVDVGGGTQPLRNEDGAVWITFNGEIYGFAALARQLERQGHRLRTRCDTEVIVHLYEEYGEAFVEHLRGEFAFALYDQRDHTLWLGRDRFGVKPLYYALSPRSLLFGSEIKAIFSNPGITRALNPSFIYAYLHGLLPPGETAFVGVRQVEPGCLLRVTAAGVEERRYWQPRFAETRAAADSTVAERESVEEFRRLFAEAVDLRLQGDQAPGVYLSGGLDSTAVATQAARLSGRSVKAFTVAFDDPAYDESARAVITAQQHALDHHVVTIRAGGLTPHFLRSLWHCEMPVVNGHGAAKLLLSGLASQHDVKSVLTGEGADELLAGYDLFRHQALLERVRRDPRNRALRAQMRRFLGSVDLLSGTVIATDYAEYDRVVERFGAYPYPALRALTLRRSARAVLSRECLRGLGASDPLEQLATTWSARRVAGDDPLSATQDFLCRTQLPSYILNCLGDRPEMANSVEGRVPFLDHKLAEFAGGLPSTLKVRDGQGKILLREALGQSNPAYRVAKQVFLSPAATLDLRNGTSPLARYLDRRVIEECGIFSPAMLKAVKHVQPWLRTGSPRRVLCDGLLTFAISVHALHELFCTNFMGAVQRFDHH